MPGGSKEGGGLEVGSAYKMKGHTQPGPFQRKSPLKQRKGEHHVEADTVGSKSSDARAGSPLERKSPLKQTEKFKAPETVKTPERHQMAVSKKQGFKWSEDTQQWTNTSTGEIFSSEEMKTALDTKLYKTKDTYTYDPNRLSEDY